MSTVTNGSLLCVTYMGLGLEDALYTSRAWEVVTERHYLWCNFKLLVELLYLPGTC